LKVMFHLTIRGLAAVSLLAVAGCGTPVRPAGDPVDVVIKVSAAGKPLNNVQLTLQPMIDGAQSQGTVEKGEYQASVIPGVYTYYIDSGKSEADLARVPEAFRMGSRERTLELTQAGTFEVDIK
jgi:hypothetical protein